MPGEFLTRSMAELPMTGSSMRVLLSMTRPEETELVSSSGASAETEMVSVSAPISRLRLTSMREETGRMMPVRLTFLKPLDSAVI